MSYIPLLEVLYDEPSPVGTLGRGTHYSVFRVPTWHDHFLRPSNNGKLLDFAVIWDEDHDERVINAVEALYFAGLLAAIRFIGERKGGLTILIDSDTNINVHDYRELARNIVNSADIGDCWEVVVHPLGNDSNLISDSFDKVAVYLQNIENLWGLGVKPKPRSAGSVNL